MSTTLIVSPPGVDVGPFSEALAKEARDVTHQLAELRSHHLDKGGDLDIELTGGIFSASAGESTFAVDPTCGLAAKALLRAMTPSPQLLLVLGDPSRCAARLAESDGTAIPSAIARYERHLRTILDSIVGCRVVVAFESDAPRSVVASFGSLPSAPLEPNAETSMTQLDPSTWIPPELSELFDRARALRGSHLHFPPVSLGDESAWTTELLLVESELEQVKRALMFTSQALAEVLEAEPASPSSVRTHVDEDEQGDQFQEPGDGEPYRMNASEDRHAYHQWLAWHRQPTLIGGTLTEPVRRAATRPPRRGKRPLISVIVPVYRTPRWALERCVGSVLAQQFADWELSVCDDGSGDADLSDYLTSLSRVDRRIKVSASPANGGIASARNRAIAQSTGRFLAFLDHDDELAPEALLRMAEAIGEDEEVDLVYSDEDKVDAAGERYDPLFKPEWSPDLLLSFAYICHLTVVRRELVEQVGGFRSEYDGSDDWDLTLRVAERARRIVHVAEVLYHWRNLPGSAAADTTASQAKPWAYEAGRRALESARTTRRIRRGNDDR